jgi:hypothetical protein
MKGKREVAAGLLVAVALAVLAVVDLGAHGLASTYGASTLYPDLVTVLIVLMAAWIAFACLLAARRLLAVRRVPPLLLAGAVLVVFLGTATASARIGHRTWERDMFGVPGACTRADVALLEAVEVPLMRLGPPRGEDDGACVLLLQSPTSDERAAVANTGAALRGAGWVPTGATSFVRRGVVLELSTSSHGGPTDVRLSLP